MKDKIVPFPNVKVYATVLFVLRTDVTLLRARLFSHNSFEHGVKKTSICPCEEINQIILDCSRLL